MTDEQIKEQIGKEDRQNIVAMAIAFGVTFIGLCVLIYFYP
jgi:hypothetical protein